MEVYHHPVATGLHASEKKWTHYLKVTLMLFLIFCCIASVQAQPLPDSILKRYNAAIEEKDKGIYLWKYLRTVISNDSNEVRKAAEILAYFQKQKDETGADNTQLFIADRLNRRGDYINGLNMALSILSNCEKRKDTIGIIYGYQDNC